MSTLLLFALFLGTPQDEYRIPRVSKEVYLTAVRDLTRAAELVTDDPGAAVEKIGGILSNSKIKYFECRLKIEIAPQEFETHNFFPYQVRGKARMAQARRATPENAARLLADAIEDFKTSAGKKVPGSAELQKEAEEKRAEALAGIKKEDPIDDFRRLKFAPKMRDNQYRAALELVNGADGQPLSEAQRESLRAEVEQECRQFVADRLNRIIRYLGDAGSVKSLKDLGDSLFRQQFANQVPPENELTEAMAADPALTWIRKHVKTLKSIQSGQAKIEDVFGAATEGLATDAPEAEGENPWFKAMALLGYDMVRDVVATTTERSEKLPKEERAKLQVDADKAHAAWKAFVDSTDKKIQERHPQLGERSDRLDTLIKTFPVELTQLASYDIDQCFLGDPGAELKKIEDALLDLVANLSTMGRVAIESRQELYTKLINAGALRRFIQGKAEDEIAREFTEYRYGLKQAGGPANPERYGPRVKRVFDSLKF